MLFVDQCKIVLESARRKNKEAGIFCVPIKMKSIFSGGGSDLNWV